MSENLSSAAVVIGALRVKCLQRVSRFGTVFTLIIEACFKLNMHFDSRYMDLLKLVYILLNVRNETDSSLYQRVTIKSN